MRLLDSRFRGNGGDGLGDGVGVCGFWIPAFAGMTVWGRSAVLVYAVPGFPLSRE